jgi:hypothetical protein
METRKEALATRIRKPLRPEKKKAPVSSKKPGVQKEVLESREKESSCV